MFYTYFLLSVRTLTPLYQEGRTPRYLGGLWEDSLGLPLAIAQGCFGGRLHYRPLSEDYKASCPCAMQAICEGHPSFAAPRGSLSGAASQLSFSPCSALLPSTPSHRGGGQELSEILGLFTHLPFQGLPPRSPAECILLP